MGEIHSLFPTEEKERVLSGKDPESIYWLPVHLHLLIPLFIKFLSKALHVPGVALAAGENITSERLRMWGAWKGRVGAGTQCLKRLSLNVLHKAFRFIQEDPPPRGRGRGGVVVVLNTPRFWFQEDNCSSMWMMS